MAKGRPDPLPYVEDGSEDVDYLDWEGGGYDGDEGPPDEPEEPEEGLDPAEHWRDMLQTTAQRIHYVNVVLGLKRGDETYSNALRYLGLIAEGKREPTADRWVNVRRAAEIDYELAHKNIPPPPTSRGPRGPGSFQKGDYLSGAMSWQMVGERDRRSIEGVVTLEGRALRLANDGQVVKAFLQGYFDGGMS